ncbi:type I-C CRISPR-associated protein Cas5c [Spirochaetota bacterium]
MQTWCLEVWGDFACFTRPEMKVERVSYDVMTPSSARAIYEAILWKPSIKWHITKIEVLKPVKWISLRRNEVGKIFAGPNKSQIDGTNHEAMGIYIEECRQQRAGLFLRDIKYRIHAWFELLKPDERYKNIPADEGFWSDNSEKQEFANANESEAKYAAMFGRRARKGQCFHRPYLGCREFACYFSLIENTNDLEKPIAKTEELGWMLYDMDYSEPSNPVPMFFKAKLENGVLNTNKHDKSLEVRS